ncbi:Ferredoxin-NADP reductase (FNR) nucleotide-binding domain [Arabidopsis thaliana x Arabidopsis arenosa]|uniref:Ferredoxin-NADP reductase (FNR) nucleotide-binding domain n=1 Tax=Arabidopsis thaliana x Arabidopsis arenosa TaxID=1240361 RepID=A0A8T2BY92_9BRAS|nr:Ferredoxin-NADP reductase (FNR) nucleotide-binding domain [Arabidopsis thaliana x Arabidopsis arenosa]
MEITKSNNGGSNPSAGEEFKDMIKGVTKFLMMVIFLGTIMLWIMMPTLTYRTKWLPHMRIKFGTSTYFGATGTTLFMYMFPMMVVACLGCVYLHFKNRKSSDHIDRETKGGVWSKLRKPMLVKGPLGIVSVTEITFLAMFVALLLWCFITYLRNSFATITPKSAAAHDESLWQAKLESAALRLGLIGNICLAFLFLPVARGSSLLPAMGLTSESSIKYHIWLGHMVMALFTVHGLCYIIYWASMHEISQMIMWDTKGVSNLAGEIALVAGLMMWATTYPKIRRRFFEVFFYTHYLYIIFMLFFVLHVGITFSFIALPGFYIFLVDRFLRFLQSRENVRLLSARILPSDTMELTFSKNSKLVYSSTSIMFVNIPSISKLQWHPFTITSSSKLEPEKLSVVIKKEGKWSTKLHHRLSSSDQIDRLAVSVEGPYGPASTDFLRHEALVMVCGGSGITPFISVIRYYILPDRPQQQPDLFIDFNDHPNLLSASPCVFMATSRAAMLGTRRIRHKNRSCNATNLHFGERPNLKKLLLDVEGSSVGVLVCGPKKMRPRQKVAEYVPMVWLRIFIFESYQFQLVIAYTYSVFSCVVEFA